MSTSITDILPKAPEDSLCTISLTGSQHKPQGMVSVTLSVAPPEKPCGLIATDWRGYEAGREHEHGNLVPTTGIEVVA